MYFVVLLISLATYPTSRPADSVVDDLLSRATTAPVNVPATRAAATTSPVATTSPFSIGKPDPDARHGTITLSDGSFITGQISTTPGKPLRIWVEEEKAYHDLPLRQIASISAEVLWEKDEPQWRFKESGSDVKVETGKTYPARETIFRFTMTDGSTLSGGIVAPLQITTATGTVTYILHKRDRGEAGQALSDLKYVQQIDFVPMRS